MKISDNIVKYEAFVYLWFDSKNRMFYLGFHKGHEDDNYTHSSTIMESFSKRNIPSYMRRRILARGSYDDMTALEVSLLKNRKEKCWDRYYNGTVVFPPPPRLGEDNPAYIDGRTSDPEYIRKKSAKYYQKNQEKKLESQRKWNKDNLEKRREYGRKYREKNPEKVRESQRKYREKILEKKRQSRAKKKLEKSLQTDSNSIV